MIHEGDHVETKLVHTRSAISTMEDFHVFHEIECRSQNIDTSSVFVRLSMTFDVAVAFQKLHHHSTDLEELERGVSGVEGLPDFTFIERMGCRTRVRSATTSSSVWL